MTKWTTELFEEPKGTYPIERWLDDLSEQKFAAYDSAINHVLKAQGIDLLGSPWLIGISKGLYEFRIRHSARQINSMYANAGESASADTEDILLRVFVTFYGDKIVLLLHGYDKGADVSEKRQTREIREAERRLRAWNQQQAVARKNSRRQGQAAAKSATRRRCNPK